MGGEIGVYSEPGEGSNFWFTAKLCESHAPMSDATPSDDRADPAAPGSGCRSLRILLAEDNHVNQKVVTAMLKGAGHSVDVAGNGVEAIEAVSTRPYDVVVMDIQMPEMDGIRATKRIREAGGDNAQIPIIALTANAMKGDRKKYLAAGMNDYVSKPIDPASGSTITNATRMAEM